MATKSTLRCGVLGTGWMLGKYAEAFRLINSASLVAVASRDLDRARTAARQWGIGRAHAGYESLVADPDIDIVINALHNGLHCEWTIRALRAGKHVLCEKPLGCSSGEVDRMFDAAHANKRWLLEGFMYRFHPQMADAKRRVARGDIGRVLYIHSSRVARGRPRDNPRFSRAAGGGALLDIGCYNVNISRMFAGSEPQRVYAHARFDPAASGTDPQTGVDLTLSGVLEFADEVTGHFVCSFDGEPTYAAEVVGTEGRLLIPNPWVPPSWPAELILVRNKNSETIRIDPPDTVEAPFQARSGGSSRADARPHNLLLLPFALEIEHLCDCVDENRPPQFPPDCDAEQDSRANARVLDALAESARSGQPVEIRPVPVQPS